MSPGIRFPPAIVAIVGSLVASLASRAAGPEPGRTYVIDPTTASVSFVLGATMHKVRGRTNQVAGRVHTQPGNAGSLVLSGEITIDAASLNTGNRRRDKKMRRESLAVEGYPTIVFSPRSLSSPQGVDVTRALSNDAPHELALYGELTIRGVSRSATIVATIASAGGRLIVEGNVELLWKDFGVPDPSVLLLRVKKRVRVSFHAEFIPQPE